MGYLIFSGISGLVTHAGCHKYDNQKNSRRLELSISKNTPHGRWGQGPGSVDPRFPAGLPFPVPEILEFVAFGDSGKFFQQFSRNFPGTFLQNSRKDPRNSHSLLEFSETNNVGLEPFPARRPWPRSRFKASLPQRNHLKSVAVSTEKIQEHSSEEFLN